MFKVASPLRKLPTTAGFTVMATAMALMLSGCGSTDASSDSSSPGEVVVYDGGGAWGEAQKAAYFEPFTKETGIKVVSAPGDSPPAMRTAIEAGNPSMDVVDIAGTLVTPWTKADLLQPIDYGSWSSAKPEDFSPYKTETTAVPSLVFATQMAYDKKHANGEINNWQDFFDSKKLDGKVTVGEGLTISSGLFEAALLGDGVPKDKLYPLDIDRAFKKLDQIKPQILKFWSTGAESVQMLADQQVVGTAAWNGRVDSLTKQGLPVASTWNQAILQTDYWAIPKGAKNSANAQKFIEFASRPDRQAEFSKLITYSPTNAKAFADIDAARQDLLPTSPNHVDVTIASSNEFWSSDSGNGVPWSDAIVERWQKWLAS